MIKIFILVSVLALLVFSMTSYMQRKEKNEALYGPLSFEEVVTLMRLDDKATLIDVRTVEEFEERSYQGSLNVPLSTIKESIETVIPDKETHLILICRSGNRSLQAIEILKAMGYKNLFDGGGLPEDLSAYEWKEESHDWPVQVHDGPMLRIQKKQKKKNNNRGEKHN